MLYSYLKVIARNILKNKIYTLINIVGLSVGIACCLMLTLYVRHELTYDQFHTRADRIYRVNIIDEVGERNNRDAVSVAAIAPGMAETFPEIESFVRVSSPHKGLFTFQNKTIETRNIAYTDSSFFDIFSFHLLNGSPAEALKKPNSIVLSESLANGLFGEKDPVGNIITLNHEDELMVTGVMEDFPANSQLQLDALISFTSLLNKKNVYLSWNGGWSYYSYLLLKENTDVSKLKEKFPKLLDAKMNDYEPPAVIFSADLEPLTEIHLHSQVSDDFDTKGSLTDVIIFSSIAVIVLVLACVNFINLTTAQVAKRVKEIGVRKVVGSSRSQLILQFLLESVAIATVSFLIALELVSTFQLEFAAILGTRFSIWDLPGYSIFTLGLVTVLFVGILAGSYPAFYLSSFRPARVLKGSFTGGGISAFNKSLLTFQFIVSVVLIICTLVIYNQLDFIRNKDLGYESENVIVIPLVNETAKNKFQLLKDEWKRLPGVIHAAASSQVPGDGLAANGYLPQDASDYMMFNVLDVDPDFFNTLSIKVVEGRNFSPGSASDSNAYLVNQALVNKMGWTEPIGKYIERNGRHPVIGVVEDFHFSTLHHAINPLIVSLQSYTWSNYDYLSLRLAGEDLEHTLAQVEQQWEKLFYNEPFNFRFLDQSFNNLYFKEKSFKQLFLFFSLIAITIAGLGLYGLVALSVQHRVKEIGIRKVLGATVLQVISLLSKDFLSRLLFANLVGWPLAYLGMNKWLATFNYRVDISFLSFAAGALFLLVLVIATILARSLRSVKANPVDYLRNE